MAGHGTSRPKHTACWRRSRLHLCCIAFLFVFAGVSAPRQAVVAAADPLINIVDLAPTGKGLPDGPTGLAVDARTHRAFVGASDQSQPGAGHLTILDTTTGRVLRRLDLAQGINTIDVDAARGHVLVTTAQGHLLLFDARSGRLLRRTPAPDDLTSLALDGRRGRLFFLTWDPSAVARLTTVDTATGRVLATTGIGTIRDINGPAGVAMDEARDRLFIVASYDSPKGPVERVTLVDAVSGRVRRVVTLGAITPDMGASPFLAPGLASWVAVDSRRGRTYVCAATALVVLDSASGRILRRLPLPPIAGGSPAVAVDHTTNRIVVATGTDVMLLDAQTGRPVHTTHVPAVEMGLGAAQGRILVDGVTDTAVFSVLDARTGAVVGQSRLSRDSGAGFAVLDDGSGQAVVTVPAPSAQDEYTGPGLAYPLDLHTGRFRHSVVIGVDPVAWGGAVDPTSRLVLLPDQTEDSLYVLAGRLLAAAPLLRAPHKSARRHDLIALSGNGIAGDPQTGRIFVISGGDGMPGTVSTLSAASGAVLRTVRVGMTPQAVDVDAAGGRVYVASTAGRSVSILDARSGALLHTVHVAGRPAALAYDARHLYVAIPNAATFPTPGVVEVRDRQSSALLRTVRVGVNPQAIATDAKAGHVFVANQDSGTVSVLDARSGRLVHTATLNHDIPFAIVTAPADGRAIVLAADVWVLDTHSGRPLRAVRNIEDVSLAAVDAPRHHVFIAAGTGNVDSLTMLDVQTGRRLHTADLDTDGSVVPVSDPVIDAARGRVYLLVSGPLGRDNVEVGPGALEVFDLRTGQRLQTLTERTVGLQSTGLVLDGRTHHLFTSSL